jgi:predicted membrane protein
MPITSCILSLPEAFPSASLVLFLFSLVLETLLILILVFSQKMRGNRLLIPDMPDLFFDDIVLFFFLGPIAGIGLLPPSMLT